jgi:hypothetical protein
MALLAPREAEGSDHDPPLRYLRTMKSEPAYLEALDRQLLEQPDAMLISQLCQSASKKDPLSACKRDPLRQAA